MTEEDWYYYRNTRLLSKEAVIKLHVAERKIAGEWIRKFSSQMPDLVQVPTFEVSIYAQNDHFYNSLLFFKQDKKIWRGHNLN